jgi:multidrug efflux pump subunit AcrA (membrane-fusion protein)
MSSLRTQLKRLRLIAGVLLVLVIIFGIGFAINRNQTNAGANLSTYTVSIQNVKQIVNVEGNVDGVNSRDVATVTGAKFIAVDVAPGQSVAAGARLARIQRTTAVSTVEEDITAPIAGTVTVVNYAVNDVVSNPTVVAFTVVDQSAYVIDLFVNENDIINLQADQTAEVLFPAIDLDQTFPATVSKVSPAPAAGAVVSYAVQVRLSEVPTGLRIGMSADVAILTAEVDDALAIPDSYLIERDGKLFVKKIAWKNETKTEYELTEVEVEVGLRTDELVEITAGLDDGDELAEPAFVQPRAFSFFGG